MTKSDSLTRYESQRYKCKAKIAKHGGNAIVNAMCTLDGDKLLVGQSDEYIRLYNIN